MQKKRDILSEKRESGMTLTKLEFTPESGNVTPMMYGINYQLIVCMLVMLIYVQEQNRQISCEGWLH